MGWTVAKAHAAWSIWPQLIEGSAVILALMALSYAAQAWPGRSLASRATVPINVSSSAASWGLDDNSPWLKVQKASTQSWNTEIGETFLFFPSGYSTESCILSGRNSDSSI